MPPDSPPPTGSPHGSEDEPAGDQVPAEQSGGTAGSGVDAHGAMGVQVGPSGVQVNFFGSLAGLLPGGSPGLAAGLARAVRVGDADLRQLGVHRAISVPGVPAGAQPVYVTRDFDTSESGLRALVSTAAARSGFVLLVGGSSVGKTRSAAEAVKELLAGWVLFHPAGPEELTALTWQPPTRAVIWLDEIQRYLGGPAGLTGGAVRALLSAPGPLVIIGTLWPEWHSIYTALPASVGADPYAREREVLALADVARVDEEFSPAEQTRAATAAGSDRQIAAVITGGRRLAQALAAAPDLVAHWDNARTAEPYAWAVLTAALDATRLGVQAPLPADLLRAAAPGYCTSRQQAIAPPGWFEAGLAYATRPLRGAAAALDPAPAAMGQVSGYIPADYLVQRATRERGATIPASTWEALTAAALSLQDTGRLARNAERLQLLSRAVVFYRRLLEAGEPVAEGLFRVAADRGDITALRALAERGSEQARLWLATIVATEDPDGKVGRLVEAGDAEALRALAPGNPYAADRLAFLLAERGDITQTAKELERRADYGDRDAGALLTELLLEHGEFDRLRALAADGFNHGWTAVGLVNKLIDLEDTERLQEVSRDGSRYATEQLANLLHTRGDHARLRQLAVTAHYDDPEWLAGLLEDLGDTDGAAEIRRTEELRAQARDGDKNAVTQLTSLLQSRHDAHGQRKLAQELRRLIRIIDDEDLEWLASVLTDLGDPDGAAEVRWVAERRHRRR